MLERTAYRVFPTIDEICKKMVKSKLKPEKEERDSTDSEDSLDYKVVDMKPLLGYLN
jgi:hypothetical protein